MCGIVGAIGLSTNRQVSFDLLTALLVKTELRGEDATGFWASCREEEKNHVFFSKEPVKSSLFVKNNWVWNNWKDNPIDLLIAHCRKRTMQNGTELVNMNNHPFLSSNGNVALIHNGNVPEFDMLKPDYEVKSDCDSEVLLRVLESGVGYPTPYQRKTLAGLNITAEQKISDLQPDQELPHWCSRMMGLRDIFARVNHGALAVAIAELWPDETRALWLFRNKERPLHVVDLREQLGQVFFVSTPEIWRNAVDSVPAAKALVQSEQVIEFPENHVWMISYDLQKKFCNRKWKIVQTRKYDTSFDKERPTKPILPLAGENLTKITTNVDLQTYTVIKTKEETNALTIIPDKIDWKDDDVPFILEDDQVLRPVVNGNPRCLTEEEAKKSFLMGEEWVAEGGARVRISDIAPNTKVKLRYHQTRPAIDLTVPRVGPVDDSKKNFRASAQTTNSQSTHRGAIRGPLAARRGRPSGLYIKSNAETKSPQFKAVPNFPRLGQECLKNKNSADLRDSNDAGTVDNYEMPVLEIDSGGDEGAVTLLMKYSNGHINAYREKAQIEEGGLQGYVLRFLAKGEATFVHPDGSFTLQINIDEFNNATSLNEFNSAGLQPKPTQPTDDIDLKAQQVATLLEQVKGKLRDLYDHELIGDHEFNEGVEFLQLVVGDLRRNSNHLGSETARRLQSIEI